MTRTAELAHGHIAEKHPKDSYPDDDDSDHGDHVELDVDAQEQKHPGFKEALKLSVKQWKEKNGVHGKIRDMTPKQKEEIRAVRKEAAEAFLHHKGKG